MGKALHALGDFGAGVLSRICFFFFFFNLGRDVANSRYFCG